MTARPSSKRTGRHKLGAASKAFRDTSAKPVQRRLLVPLAAVLLVVVGGFGAVLLSIQRDHLRQSSREKLEVAVYDLEDSLSEGAQLLAALEGVLLQDANLREALKTQDRDRLLRDNEAVFAHLQEEHGITHFYFHRPDRVNLLRLHQPARNGDLIDRFTARQAERTGKTASGIELGSLEALEDGCLDLLRQVAESTGIALDAAQARSRQQELLEESQAQSEELQAQTTALQAREKELKSLNQNLAEKTAKLPRTLQQTGLALRSTTKSES